MSEALAKLLPYFPIEAPAGRPRLSIELLEDPPAASDLGARATPGQVWGTVRSIEWDEHGQIESIYEQVLLLVEDATQVDPPERLQAVLHAHREVLGEVFARATPRGNFPCDLLFLDALLKMKHGSPEAFDKALRAKKRLGRLLTP